MDGAISQHAVVHDQRRWLALMVLCLGALMVTLDTTIVNVALPWIQSDLGFTEATLVWVVNAYMLSFGGFLLLSGRLGDVHGHRRMFLTGIILFTLASLACGVSDARASLVISRAVQGIGAALVSAVALSLIVNMFPRDDERAKAMGIYSFVCAGGGGIGLLLGGALMSVFTWHWIFLVNLPIGAAVYALCRVLVPRAPKGGPRRPLDIWGAVTVTASLMLAMSVVAGSESGWSLERNLLLSACSAILFAAFLIVETRVSVPLVPLGFFRIRSLTVSCVVRVLWTAGLWVWFFTTTLYMQLVLRYEPMDIALAFLPFNLIVGVLSIGFSAWLVGRLGAPKLISLGMFLGALGLALLTRAPVNGDVVTDVLPSTILLGLGSGIAFNPLVLAAMRDVASSETGLASGILNTTSLMGAALGLAVIASLSVAHSADLVASGMSTAAALTVRYRTAFLSGAICAMAAGVVSMLLLRPRAAVPGKLS